MPHSNDQTTAEMCRTEARKQLAESIGRIEHCVRQLDDAQLWWRPQPAQNSIANLVLHLCGNLQQRIVSLLGGAQDTRNRPLEFSERGPIPGQELMRRLRDVASEADRVLADLTQLQLAERKQYQGATRQFDEPGLGVVLRTLVHLGGHTQEIVCLTRMQMKDAYAFETAP